MLNVDERNKLLGALIGMAKACESNPMTEEATRLIIQSLRMLGATTPIRQEKYQELLEEVYQEKYTIVPNCKTCQSPCGNTSDYEMQLLWSASTEIREGKLTLIAALEELAEAVFMKRVEATGTQLQQSSWADLVGQDTVFLLYQGLATISFDYTPAELYQLSAEIKRAL